MSTHWPASELYTVCKMEGGGRIVEQGLGLVSPFHGVFASAGAGIVLIRMVTETVRNDVSAAVGAVDVKM